MLGKKQSLRPEEHASTSVWSFRTNNRAGRTERVNGRRTQTGFAPMDVLFIGSILCADRRQSQADFSLKTRTQFDLMHTIHSHTHILHKRKKPCRDKVVHYQRVRDFHICIMVWLHRLNHKSQTPFPHRALQFNHISCPLPLLGLKMHVMKEGFSMEVEGRAKWVFSEAETGQKAWPPWTLPVKGSSCKGAYCPKALSLSQHRNKTYTMCFPEAFSEVITPYKLRL